jgi:hypothetical protein
VLGGVIVGQFLGGYTWRKRERIFLWNQFHVIFFSWKWFHEKKGAFHHKKKEKPEHYPNRVFSVVSKMFVSKLKKKTFNMVIIVEQEKSELLWKPEKFVENWNSWAKKQFSFWIFPCLKCLVNIIIVCVFIIIIIVKNYDEDSIYCSSSSGVTVLVVVFFLIIIFFIFTKNFLVKNTVLIWSFFFQSVGHWTLLFKFLMYVVVNCGYLVVVV